MSQPAPVPEPPKAPEPSHDDDFEIGAIEPVSAEVHLKSDEKLNIKATAFSRENGSYIFISFPRMRGMKTATILQANEIASISITAPEPDIERLKAPAPPLVSQGFVTIPPSTGAGSGLFHRPGDDAQPLRPQRPRHDHPPHEGEPAEDPTLRHSDERGRGRGRAYFDHRRGDDAVI